MKAVKFISHDTSEEHFVATLRKNVNEYFRTNHLSTKANTAMVLKTIIMLSIYVVPFIILLLVPVSNWIALLLVVTMGFGIAGVGMGVMHDAMHGAYSQKQWINKLLSGSLYLLGSNVLNWKIQHNVLHHTYTNISGLDEDIDSKGPIRLSKDKPLKKYHKFQYLYAFLFYGLMTIVMLTNDFKRLYKYSKEGLLTAQHAHLRSEIVRMVFRKSAYLLVVIGLPLWLTRFTILEVLLGFFIMHWVAGIILSFVFQMAHVVEGAEQYPEGDREAAWQVHQVKTTSDFARNNLFLNWYVGGLNFQIEHHLFPNICHIHYKKIAPIVERTAREYGISYNLKPSFRAALLSHIHRLKSLGTN